MDYWQTILHELQNYEQKDFHCFYTNLQETDIYIEKMDAEFTLCKPPSKPKVTYQLPSPFQHLHLTEREAECLYCLQQNHTIKSTGILLNLSARTVEFYLKNIKTKMKLRTKSEVLAQLTSFDLCDFDEQHEALIELIETIQPNSYQSIKTSPKPALWQQ